MYGAGFFYIPGTEICMNINGYVRSTYEHSEFSGKSRVFGTPFPWFLETTPALAVLADVSDNTSNWTVRGRLNFDVRNETEYGTLRSQLRLQGGDADASGDQNVAIDRALISLAGFRLGYSDSYWTTNHDYGAGSPAINDGFYDYDQAIFFDYTANLMDGLAVTVGVQDTNGADSSDPDFYAGVNYGSPWGTFAFTAIRDSSARKFSIVPAIGPTGFADFYPNNDDSWAFKASAIIPLADSGWSVGGWYSWSDNPYNKYLTGTNSFWGGRLFSAFIPLAPGSATGTPGVGTLDTPTDTEWGIQISGILSQNVAVYGLYTRAEGELKNNTLLPGLQFLDAKVDSYSVGVIWTPVLGLNVQLEYTKSEGKVVGLINTFTATGESDAFLARVTRSF